MNNSVADLSKIHQITQNIFLSGIIPLDENYDIIKKLRIKYVLSCVDRKYTSKIHDKLMCDNPDIVILYLPYDDDIRQNLWKKNKDQIDIVKYITNINDYNELSRQMRIYQNKPMIEIGYHFMENAISSNQNILVHCMAGISRSVSMISYYLMKKYHISADKAISTIRNIRNIVNPNDSFKYQLIRYQIKRDQFTENDAEEIISKIEQI